MTGPRTRISLRREELRGQEHPCPGCGRVVAYRRANQYLGGMENRGGGKHRTPHNCQHGEPCIFGTRIGGNGWNWPTCEECLKLRRAEYIARVAHLRQIASTPTGDPTK